MKEARFWRAGKNKSVTCLLCPRCCQIVEGSAGSCVIRKNTDGVLYQISYGKASSVAIDPVEKKPLFHFYPGSAVFSFGTIGCNLSCDFCQNWNITKTHDERLLMVEFSPDEIVLQAKMSGSKSIAFTYNDPIPFAEFAIDVAIEARKQNIKTIAVTNGYINPKPAREFFSVMDAANVDLKSFSENFYKKYTDSGLKPILKTLDYIFNETSTWLEITTLLIPGLNDSRAEVQELCRWIMDHLGPDVPLHFSAFHPEYHLMNIPVTPASTLYEAREIAMNAGLNFVYTGNIPDPRGESTWCPGCKKMIIERSGYRISQINLDSDGKCLFCQHQIPGYF